MDRGGGGRGGRRAETGNARSSEMPHIEWNVERVDAETLNAVIAPRVIYAAVFWGSMSPIRARREQHLDAALQLALRLGHQMVSPNCRSAVGWSVLRAGSKANHT